MLYKGKPRKSTNDQRGEQLRTFDQHANDLNVYPDSRQLNLGLLWELAGSLSESLRTWSEIVSRLELAYEPAFDCERAGALIIESAFDEILDAPACRILSAAFTFRVSA